MRTLHPAANMQSANIQQFVHWGTIIFISSMLVWR